MTLPTNITATEQAGPPDIDYESNYDGEEHADHHNQAHALLNNAASTNTSSVLVMRDSSGRARFGDPLHPQDAATKGYVDGEISNGGGGNGATELSDLTDVDTSGVTDGQFLAYFDGDSEWRPVDAPSGNGGSVDFMQVRAVVRETNGTYESRPSAQAAPNAVWIGVTDATEHAQFVEWNPTTGAGDTWQQVPSD